MKQLAYFTIILCLLVLGLTTSGATAATPLGSGFTYQGELQDGSGPVNGSCDFKFSLWDAAVNGNRVGQEQTLGAVAIADGRFTVLLNNADQFSPNPFDGQARWLQISVRCPAGGGAYTGLQPRQQLTAAPYAAFSQSGGGADSDHNHLGQTWTGTDNPLRIEGSYFEEAPLILSNSAIRGDGLVVESGLDDGVQVTSAGDDGVVVNSAGDDGIQVLTSGDDGVYVYDAGDDGVYVYEAGNPSSNFLSTSKNGIEVAGAEANGLFIGRADEVGVQVNSAGDNGVQVDFAGANGVYVGSVLDDGVKVYSTGDDGLQVSFAGGDGVYVYSATDYAGYFGGDIYVTGSCIGCVHVEFGVNSGAASLEPGDIVTVLGTIANKLAGQPLLMQVSVAAYGETAIGVVQGQAELQQNREEQIEENGESRETADRLVPSEGAARPGEYVTIAIYGPVQVKASQIGSQITAGTRLAVDENGRARPLQTTEVNGIQVAESAPTIGIALDQPSADGLVWVLVNPQ